MTPDLRMTDTLEAIRQHVVAMEARCEELRRLIDGVGDPMAEYRLPNGAIGHQVEYAERVEVGDWFRRLTGDPDWHRITGIVASETSVCFQHRTTAGDPTHQWFERGVGVLVATAPVRDPQAAPTSKRHLLADLLALDALYRAIDELEAEAPWCDTAPDIAGLLSGITEATGRLVDLRRTVIDRCPPELEHDVYDMLDAYAHDDNEPF